MEVIIEITTFLIRTFGGLYFWAVLMRFLLQLARADFYNPISQALVRITNPLLKPLRRIIPGLFGLDIASLVLAIVVKLIMLFLLVVVLGGVGNPNIPLLLIWALLACVVAILNIYYLTMLAAIIVSWIAPGSYHPAVQLIHQIAEPVMAPFRRLLPAMSGIDFSPMVAFAAIYVVQIILRAVAAYFGLPAQFAMGLLILAI